MHRVFEPKIMYFGTPVVLVSTLNEDGSPNLAPMSSAWWLNQSCMLGLSTRSKTVENLRREGECVLNLPSADMVDTVDKLALTTGSDPVPEYKKAIGTRFVKDKFGEAGLTPVASERVKAPRVLECPVQLEAKVVNIHPFQEGDSQLAGIEVRVVRVYLDDAILSTELRHHIDPGKWRPLIMSFCEFYGLGANLHPSRLAQAFDG
ncbi:MAG: flavin reductase family protein [Meiothermus sp.]|nr:flavin reductase family protein [Meiothermus sp.]